MNDNLLRLCRAQAKTIGAEVDPLVAVEHLDWESARTFPDWRSHVEPTVADIWESLGLEARLAIYLDAAIHAEHSYS